MCTVLYKINAKLFSDTQLSNYSSCPKNPWGHFGCVDTAVSFRLVSCQIGDAAINVIILSAFLGSASI